MNVYIAEYFILMLNVFLSHGFSDKGRKRLYIVSSIELILIAILRSQYDTAWPDTSNYVDTLNYLNNTISLKDVLTTGWEPGIVILGKIISFFSSSSQAYLIVFSLLILIPIFVTIWKYSYFPMLGLFVFYAMGNLTQTSIYRQWLAIAILTFSIKYIYERQPVRFFAVVLLSALFHRVAIVFTVIYFFYNISISSKKILGAAGISICVYLFGSKVLDVLNRFARIEHEPEQNGGVTFLLILWGCVLLSYMLSKDRLRDDSFKLAFNLILIAASFQPLSFIFSLWVRAVYFFSVYLMLLIPNTIVHVENMNENNKKLSIIIEFIFMLIMLGWFTVGGVSEYIPMWAAE